MNTENKKLKIAYVPQLNRIEIEHVAEQIEDYGTMARIDSLNWKEQYSYMPLTTFAIARTDTILFIKFIVNGTMLKAVYSNDLDPVHKDSCVEFFCKLPEGEKYMNFEFNCIGTCMASTRLSRTEGIQYRTQAELQQILRYSSIGKRAFCEMEGMFEWELTVGIPFNILGFNAENMPEKLLGNFYKCADDTNSIHFVSWNPIKTANPDFHRPDFFGELYF